MYYIKKEEYSSNSIKRPYSKHTSWKRKILGKMRHMYLRSGMMVGRKISSLKILDDSDNWNSLRIEKLLNPMVETRLGMVILDHIYLLDNIDKTDHTKRILILDYKFRKQYWSEELEFLDSAIEALKEKLKAVGALYEIKLIKIGTNFN
jgi:hypothetical protein